MISYHSVKAGQETGGGNVATVPMSGVDCTVEDGGPVVVRITVVVVVLNVVTVSRGLVV